MKSVFKSVLILEMHFLLSCNANAANHRQEKVAFGLCKMERSGIHKPSDAFDCPSAFALLAADILLTIKHPASFVVRKPNMFVI